MNILIFWRYLQDNPIGNNFPETNGASPFPCKESHGRLVLRNDLVLYSEYYRGQNSRTQQQHKQKEQQMQQVSMEMEHNSQSQTSEHASINSTTLEFSTKLDNFYELCLETNSLLEKTRAKLEVIWGQKLPGDTMSISVLLGSSKAYLREMEQRTLQVQMCQNVRFNFFPFVL